MRIGALLYVDVSCQLLANNLLADLVRCTVESCCLENYHPISQGWLSGQHRSHQQALQKTPVNSTHACVVHTQAHLLIQAYAANLKWGINNYMHATTNLQQKSPNIESDLAEVIHSYQTHTYISIMCFSEACHYRRPNHSSEQWWQHHISHYIHFTASLDCH